MNARHQNETMQTLLSASPMFMLHAESLESLVEEGKRSLPSTFFSAFPQHAQRDENFCFSSYLSSITSNAINSVINPHTNNLVFNNIQSETTSLQARQQQLQQPQQQQMRYMSAIDSLNYSLQQSIQPQQQAQPQGSFLPQSRLVPQTTPEMFAFASQLPQLVIPSNQPPSQQQPTLSQQQPNHQNHPLIHHNLQIQIQKPHHQRQQQHQVLQNRESPISSPTGSACSSTCTSPVAPYPTSGMFSSNSEEEPLNFIKKYLENYQGQNVGSSSQPSHEMMQTIHQLAEATRKAEQKPKKSAKGQKENASIKWKRALQEHQQSVQKQAPPSAAQGSRATASSSSAPAATTGIRKKKRSKKWTDMTPLHMKMPQ